MLPSMPRPPIDHEQIQKELAFVSEPVDSNICGCRNARCCQREGHELAHCLNDPETRFWTYRWEYFCNRCRAYEFGGEKYGQTRSGFVDESEG